MFSADELAALNNFVEKAEKEDKKKIIGTTENKGEINKLKEELRKKENIIKDKNIIITDLKKKLEMINQKKDNMEKSMLSLQELLSKKEIEIDKLKNELKNISNKIDPLIHESQITSVHFTSDDQKINYSIACTKKNVFAEIEEKLYKEYPEYRETNNFFMANGVQILRFKTIEENQIGNGRPVILCVPGELE